MKSLDNELNVNYIDTKHHVYENFFNSNNDYDFDKSITNEKKSKNITSPKKAEKSYYDSKYNQCKETFESGVKNCEFAVTRLMRHCNGLIKKVFVCPRGAEADMKGECNLNKTQADKSIDEACSDYLKEDDFDGMGKDLAHLKSIDGKFDQSFDADFNYSLNQTETKLIAKNKITKIQTDLENVKEKSKLAFNYINFLLKMIQLIANYSYSFVFLNSYKYNFKYLNDISFDNNCVTKYFIHLDTRRLKQKFKRTLLPLKKHEKETIHSPYQLFVSAYQKPSVKINIFLYTFLLAFLFSALAIDYVWYDFLSIFKEHAIINYKLYKPSNESVLINIEGKA